jgi:hypothetical protein
LENNVAYSIEVKRKITNKDGRVFSEDMQVVTSNACCSIALRNAIFKCVPLGITNSVQEKIKKVMMGDEKDFATIRKNAVVYFEEKGVTEKNILALFEKKSVEELTREDVFDLRGIATAIIDGDTTLELSFSITPKGNALGKASKSLSIPIEEMDATVFIEEKKLEVTETGLEVSKEVSSETPVSENIVEEKEVTPEIETKEEQKEEKSKVKDKKKKDKSTGAETGTMQFEIEE